MSFALKGKKSHVKFSAINNFIYRGCHILLMASISITRECLHLPIVFMSKSNNFITECMSFQFPAASLQYIVQMSSLGRSCALCHGLRSTFISLQKGSHLMSVFSITNHLWEQYSLSGYINTRLNKTVHTGDFNRPAKQHNDDP